MKGMLNGIVTRKKDDGKVSSMLYIAQIPLSKYDSNADVALGYKTKEVYVGWEVDAKPGDTIDVEYDEGFQGRADVTDVTVIERRKQ